MTTRADDPLVGSLLELEAGPIAHGGHVVARHEGRVIFVRHALPGERVQARVTSGKEGDSFLRADAVAVHEAASGRVKPPCRYAGPGGCGGCDFQHVDLATQRLLKGQVVSEQLRRLAGIELDVEVEPVPGDEDGLRWRTRMEFAAGAQGEIGLREHRSRQVVPVQDCLIATRPVIDSGVLQRRWPGVASVDVAQSSTGQVTVVPNGGSGAGGESGLVGSGDSVLTERVPLRTGEELRLQVAAQGFWQVHPGAARTFVDVVLEWLQPRPGERALDLYCGVGLFAAALQGPLGSSGQVIAVEADRRAVAGAEENLRREPRPIEGSGDGVTDGTTDGAIGRASAGAAVRVQRSRVDRAVRAMVQRGRRADLVVLDPPRAGAGRAVVRDIVRMQPRAVAYVACDPAALARDLATFGQEGYQLTRLRAFDAFPMTHHMECIALLERA